MKDYEKIRCLKAYCYKQAGCNKCSLRNIDGDDGCCGPIEDWSEEEKHLKEVLTDRRVVELRNGERYLVVGDFLMGENDYFIKDDFTNNLTHISLHKLDIMRIYKEISRINALHYNYKDLGIIWERKPKKMTKEEIEEALGYEIEIVEEVKKI